MADLDLCHLVLLGYINTPPTSRHLPLYHVQAPAELPHPIALLCQPAHGLADYL